MIPIVLVTGYLYNSIKSFRNGQFDSAYYESRKGYVLFSVFYLLIHLLELHN